MKTPIILLVSGLTAFFLASCTENGDDPEPDPQLTVSVTDPGGNPVEGASLYYLFTQNNSGVQNLSKPCPSSVISFTLTEESDVTVTLTRYLSDQVLQTIYTGTGPKGNNSVSFSPGSFANGVYTYHISAGKMHTEGHLVLSDHTEATIGSSTPLTKTDASGKMTFPIKTLGSGFETKLTDATGNTIGTRRISESMTLLVLYKGVMQSKQVTIRNDQPATASFTF
ncbi:MAG: hypothetical protein L6Q77_01015 [Bacteroidetes bacterium]|nr:hypothetical protein [Bacteroidota bacterium]